MGLLPKPYLSISQINTYLSCPKKYQYRYLEQLDEPKSSALVTGSSFHKIVEEANKQKQDTGELISDDDIESIHEEYWTKREGEIDWEEGEDPEEEKGRAVTLAKAYLESDIGKRLDPMATEVKMQADVDGIPFMGYIDIIENDGSIRDMKTSRKSPAKDIADKSLQLAGYSYLYRETTGLKEKITSLDYAVSLKKAPKIVRLESEITDGRIDRFRDTTYNVANAIVNEIFYRNEGMACGYCPFKDVCKQE